MPDADEDAATDTGVPERTAAGDVESVRRTAEELLAHPPQEFEVRVERGKIAEFADALGDEDPLFHDPTAARDRGYDDVPAPLTFVETNRFERMRRPAYEPDAFFDERSPHHAGQEYEYERQPVAGETLAVRRTFDDVRMTEGDAGTLLFGTFRTEYRDEEGELVLTTLKTKVLTGVGE